MSARDEVTKVAEDYYDSADADAFYSAVWGGEDIHIGLYSHEGEPIRAASERTVQQLAAEVPAWSSELEVLDCGSGYGGAARYLAKTHGCKVSCLNLSNVQNARNLEMSAAQGFSETIEVVHASFEDVPRPDASYDVVWSQDAILHSGRKDKTFAEVARVLRPGGHFVFTDPMQADDCPPNVLSKVLARIHLDQMGSFATYRALARANGLEEVRILDLTDHLVTHYASVRRELRERTPQLEGKISSDYIERMDQGLGHWIDAGQAGYLAWGILHFVKKG